jgi:tetratricopeptide (TPR) repeat protein
MSPISQRFAIPVDDDDFELMCRDVLRLYWSRPGLEIFGKRGERQDGIDILDLGGEMPLYAAQCKLKEEHKSLPPNEVQAEVDKAKKFIEPLGKYAILTTGKVSTQAQMKVREINLAHRASGLFEVELLTWEQICPLLQQYSEVQARFYSDIPTRETQKIERGILAISHGVESLTAKVDGDQIDLQINEARDEITKRQFQLATLLLNRIQHSKGDQLTPRQKFRVLSNLGAAALGLGNGEAAAQYFRDAAVHQPMDEHARINEVLAYLLVNDMTSCHGKASALRREYPSSARLASLWVSSAPRKTSLTEVEHELDSILLTDPEVCVALARKALMELQLPKAFQNASAASKAAPKWSQPHLVIAQASLGKALHVQFGFDEKSSFQEQTLLDAESESSIALDLARAEKDGHTEKMALVQRAELRLLLGKKDEASSDAQEAERLAPDDPQVMLAVAEVRLSAGRLDEGIVVLTKAFTIHPDPDIAFVYARALSNRGRDGDLDQALRVLKAVQVKDLRSELRPTLITQVFQCFAKKKDWAGANQYLTEISDLLEAVILETIRGYLSHYQQRPKEAEEHALKAKSLMSSSCNAETKQYLAGLLILIGRPGDALPIWQDLFNTKSRGFDPGNLLNCAARLHRDDIVLQTCDELHARGVNDWHLLEFEASYLEKYKIDTAIERLQEFIAKNPGHKLARLRLSLIGLGINRPELVHGGVDNAPSLSELPLHYAIPAVQVLKYGGNPDAAVDYAYRFLRQNFGHIEAHQAFVISMMPGYSAPDIPAEIEIAGPDTAVCYQELPDGHEKWAVLEETAEPSAEFEEVGPTSGLAHELRGKRVGEIVTIAPGHLQVRSAKILRILPKYVRRYQDTVGEMQIRFGAASSVESVRIDTSRNKDPRESLKVIFDDVEKRAKAVAEVREIYRTIPVSLHLYGSRFGKNAYTAVIDLAREENENIKCCLGTLEERTASIQSLQTAKGLIVDLTSLATLRLLQLEYTVLSTTKFRLVIAERTWVLLNEMLFNERIFSGPSGTLAFEDGRHVMYEHPAEEKERRNSEDQKFLDFLKATVEIRSARGLAALEPQKRDTLKQLFGPYGAESILLASEPGYVLWTDDVVQGQIAAQEFGASKGWTQLVLGALADAGLLKAEEYHNATARLIGMNFAATQFDNVSLLASLRLAKWNAGAPPAAQMLKIFADPNADLQALLRIFVQFTIKLHAEFILPETKCSITTAFLDSFAQRPDAMTLLQGFRKLSPRLFGLNQIGRAQFETCFDRWQRQRDEIIVIP